MERSDLRCQNVLPFLLTNTKYFLVLLSLYSNLLICVQAKLKALAEKKEDWYRVDVTDLFDVFEPTCIRLALESDSKISLAHLIFGSYTCHDLKKDSSKHLFFQPRQPQRPDVDLPRPFDPLTMVFHKHGTSPSSMASFLFVSTVY